MKLTVFSSGVTGQVSSEQITEYDPRNYNCVRENPSQETVPDPVLALLSKVRDRKSKADNILEISGPSGTGKTTLCLQFLNRLDSKVWTKFVLVRAKDIGTKEFLTEYMSALAQPKESKVVYIVDDRLDADFWNDLITLTDSLYTKIGGNDCLFVILSTGGIVPSIRPGRLLDRLTLRPLSAMVAGALVAARGGDSAKVRKEMTLAEVYSKVGKDD